MNPALILIVIDELHQFQNFSVFNICFSVDSCGLINIEMVVAAYIKGFVIVLT